jgi:small subunit ribosomal protein S19e
MTTPYDVPADKLIEGVSKEFSKIKEVKAPDWANYAKTGCHKQFAPSEKDWWNTRVAAVFRKIYVKGPIGIERLSAEFGGKRDRGSKPYHARKGSGAIVRSAASQLESAGFIETIKGKGRQITPKGRKYLDDMAHKVMKEVVKEIPALQKY